MVFSRRFLAKGIIFTLITVLLAIPMLASFAGASSHREAPMISQDPAVDNTDVYAFVSPDRPDSVTMIGCWYPFQEPGGGPNFYRFADNAEYRMHVDNNGDARPDATFIFKFRTEVRNPDTFLYNTGTVESIDSPNLNIRQFYEVWRISDPGEPQETRLLLGQNIPVPPVNIGPKSTPNYEALARQAIRPIGQGYNVFAGQRDDPFWIDLAATFDLLNIRPPGPAGDSGAARDTLSGYNVQCIALQSPIAFLTSNGQHNMSANDPNAIIGVWMTAHRPRVTTQAAGKTEGAQDMVQVSRLGNPLVNEVVIPLGLKDAFNSLEPHQDAGALAQPDGSIPVVQNPELARLLNAIFGVDVPPTPRNDLVNVFLLGVEGLNRPANVQPSDMLRLNTAIGPTGNPNRLGVIGGDLQGFPNGRRLGDDVVDIALRVVAGVLVEGFNKAPNNQLSDGVTTNDRAFSSVFPYLASPHQGFESAGSAQLPVP